MRQGIISRRTLQEAVGLFSEVEEAAYLSGGHTLIPTMKGRLAAPAHLIDVRRIPGAFRDYCWP